VATDDGPPRVRLTRVAWSLIAVCLVLCAASTIFYAWRGAADWTPDAAWAQRALGHQTNVTAVFAGVIVLGTVLLLHGAGRRAEIVLAVVLGLAGWALEYLPIPNNTLDWRDVVAGFVAAAAGVLVLELVRARGTA
jgi:hypothetical protein